MRTQTVAKRTKKFDSGVPAFLVRKRGESKPAKGTAPSANSIVVSRRDDEGEKLNAGLAQYGLRVPAVGESGDAGFRIDEGVIPRRWAREGSTVMELARRAAAKRESFERSLINRDDAREKAKAEKVQRKAKMYEGMTSLVTLIAAMGADAPSIGRAKKAIERAHLIHRKFHFGPKEVEQATKVVRALPAVAAFGARAAGAGATRPVASAPAGIVRVTVKSNPHKPGSGQHDRMAVLMAHAGKPVADYLKAGGCRLKLKHALSQGWVVVDASVGAVAPAPAPAATPASQEGKGRAAKAPSKVPAGSLAASLAKVKTRAKKVRRK